VHQSTKTDGSIKACCRSLPEISNIKHETLEQAWNNHAIRKLRLDLLNGIRNERCNVCWRLEDSNVTSLRQKYNRNELHQKKAAEAINSMSEDGTVSNTPAWIEFKLSNICNLKCRMCHPMDSTKWYNDYKSIEHLHDESWQTHIRNIGLDKTAKLVNYNDDFFNELPRFMKNIDQLAFAGGEPLMDENHYRVLDSVMSNASNIELRYATNLTMLKINKFNALDYFPHFKKVILSASLDGPPDLNEYIRGDSDSSTIEQNIKYIKQFKNTTVIGKLTVQALNIYYVPESLEWFRELQIDTDMHFVTWPAHLDARIWDGTAREKIIEKLKNYITSLPDNQYYIRETAQNTLNYFIKDNLYTTEKFKKFIEWNKILDKRRNESFDNFEFLRDYMNE
jgi:sulfatase maturation enzyme AslB (radical SAM superfamily)